jgi:clan AA aspartic protease (TIGR02281 family)
MPPPPAEHAEAPPSPAAATVEATPRQPQQMIVRYHGQDARTQRILVPITVNGSATVMMALDTGAPSTVISKSLAEQLGVLRRDDGVLLTSASGIGGSAPAVLVVLESLGLGEARDQFVPATVTGDLSENFAGLLGMDFITTFKLKVDAARQVLILTKPNDGGNTPAGHDERWWRRLFQQFKDQRRLWESYRDFVDKRVSDSEISAGPSIDRLRRLQALAVSQVDEAGKLLQRLERHASNHAVPREWR